MGVMQGLLTSVVMVLTSLKSMGPLGRLGYVLGLAVWTFCCLPTTPIELASGFIFPLWASTLLSVAGKTTGSVLALLLGRRFLKPLVSRLLERSGSNAGHSSAMHRHLVSELQKRPIQTMSILRAAPLPTPFKIYGLCMFQPELVPVNTYFVVALIINTAWSLVWSLTGSSASSLQEITEGRTDMSKGKLVAQGFAIASFLLAFGAFGRFAKAQMQPPSEDGESTPNAAARGARGVRRRKDCAVEYGPRQIRLLQRRRREVGLCALDRGQHCAVERRVLEVSGAELGIREGRAGERRAVQLRTIQRRRVERGARGLGRRKDRAFQHGARQIRLLQRRRREVGLLTLDRGQHRAVELSVLELGGVDLRA